ncbi:MAG: spermidine/putrescine ABC transporter substrate-binding protein, partial [Actinomycetota bacterium]|nr:spermidine/putrescine ABC transporter substrate-binding protein [Actinomycetota bacterium]
MSNNDGLRILASTQATQRLSRRSFLAGATVTAVAGSTLITGCGSSEPEPTAGAGSSAGPIEDQLNMYTWGEYDSPKVLKEFTASVGPKLQVDSYNSNEEMVNKLVATKGTSGYDLVVPTGPFIPQMVANDLLEPIDLTRLPNFSNVDTVYLGQSWDPNNDHSVPKAWGTTGYAYDTTKVDREMATWQDFLDVASTTASGQVSILDSPDNVVGLYLWAKDIDWMTTDMALLDEAQDYLVNTLAPHVKKFESYPGSNGMPQGSFWLVHA